MRRILLVIFVIGLLFINPHFALAIEDPLSVPNNRFGIHIIDENDLEDAAKLVNSNGGDWGYVTLVIRKDERDTSRWQQTFNKMRRFHLIPIVRMATRQAEVGWEKPSNDEIDGWVAFFNSLNWVIKNRYVVVGNEPNHAAEWGGEVNPKEYAQYLAEISSKLKISNKDYFILQAGFDASAPNTKSSMSENTYLQKMIESEPKVFNFIDGWVSHSYPNPAFSGSQDDSGRGTIRTFEWEQNLLESYGVDKRLPVFITETGWAHNMDGGETKLTDTKTIAAKLRTAYQNAWSDENIVAVTPFVLNYRDEPFSQFSWKRKDGSFYDFYTEVESLIKTSGKPLQIVSVDIKTLLFPPVIPVRGEKVGIVLIENQGQSIWDGSEHIRSTYKGFEIEIEPKVLINNVEPGRKAIAVISVK